MGCEKGHFLGPLLQGTLGSNGSLEWYLQHPKYIFKTNGWEKQLRHWVSQARTQWWSWQCGPPSSPLPSPPRPCLLLHSPYFSTLMYTFRGWSCQQGRLAKLSATSSWTGQPQASNKGSRFFCTVSENNFIHMFILISLSLGMLQSVWYSAKRWMNGSHPKASWSWKEKEWEEYGVEFADMTAACVHCPGYIQLSGTASLQRQTRGLSHL